MLCWSAGEESIFYQYAGFEPTISAGERPQTYALDRAATGTGKVAALPTSNYTDLEDCISYNPVFALRNQVCVIAS